VPRDNTGGRVMDGLSMQAVVPPIIAHVDTVTPQSWAGWVVVIFQGLAAFSVAATLLLTLQERIIASRPYLHLLRDRDGRLQLVNAGSVHAFDILVKVHVESATSFGLRVSDQHESAIDLGGLRPSTETEVDLATAVRSLLRRELLPQLEGTPFATTRAWGKVRLTVMYTGASHMDAFTDRFRVEFDCLAEHAFLAEGTRGLKVHDFRVTRTAPMGRSTRSYRQRLLLRGLRDKIASWRRTTPPREP